MCWQLKMGERENGKKSNYHTIFSLLCFSSQNNLKREKKTKTRLQRIQSIAQPQNTAPCWHAFQITMQHCLWRYTNINTQHLILWVMHVKVKTKTKTNLQNFKESLWCMLASSNTHLALLESVTGKLFMQFKWTSRVFFLAFRSTR